MPNRAHRSVTVRTKPKNIHKKEHHHYWPYLPMMAMTLALLGMTIFQPLFQTGVLSYATEMSRSALLESTNNRRVANGVGKLKLNDGLNAAALAKANDMKKRDYWSHNTPDGEEPWIFFEDAGYKYLKAGENLAYGFSTSDSTVTGWMNSPSHRDNMLDETFLEVGFGYVNSENFIDKGPETIVVAMYGRPQVLAQSQTSPRETPASQQTEVAQAEPEPAKPVAETKKSTPKKETPVEESLPVNSDTELSSEPVSQPVTRIESYSNGNKALLFATGIITGGVVVFLLIKHAVRLRHLIKDSEQFILHHPVLDTVLLAVVLAGTFLLQTSGVIR